MHTANWSKRAALLASLLTVVASSAAFAASTDPSDDTATELKALKTRIADLEAKQNENWLTQERTNQIRSIVEETIADAKTRGQFADGPSVGYNNGFFIQTPDNNFKLVVGGYVQVRYEYAHQDPTKGHTITGKPADGGNASGFDIRRARISFSGNAFTPDLTYKLEGDFYGTGGQTATTTVQGTSFFTVSDAYVGYRFTDLFKVRAGSFKAPFAKAELTSDPTGTFAEREEVLAPFDPVRVLGVSLYGDVIKDQLGYEANINDGGNSNTLRSDDTVGTNLNIDNRLAYYSRVQWAGAGKISDFADESDLRKDNRDFIWLLGGAGGYESQNSTSTAYPSPQSTTPINGLSNGTGFTNYTLNGDVFRATVDWSGKWHGASFLAAGYFQEVNANPIAGTTTGGLPTIGKSNFFQQGYYGQVGYFIIPQKLELVGRAGALLTEGNPDIGEYYSGGVNYYVYGHNFKIQSDVTWTPEAAYTSATSSQVQNTQDLIFRVQLQLKF